jgi:hypothetical protein
MSYIYFRNDKINFNMFFNKKEYIVKDCVFDYEILENESEAVSNTIIAIIKPFLLIQKILFLTYFLPFINLQIINTKNGEISKFKFTFFNKKEFLYYYSNFVNNSANEKRFVLLKNIHEHEKLEGLYE